MERPGIITIKQLTWEAFIQQSSDEKRGVYTLVPRATPGYHKLTTGEQQRRAIRLVEPHSDRCKLVLIVEGKRQHLVDLVQVQRFL
jgi:hypothetical protein